MNSNQDFCTTIATNTPQRKLYIDALRGMAMIIVVYGHCLLSKSTSDYSAYFVFTSPWNVALFFAISGYLFTPRGGDVKVFFKYVFQRLIIPWIVLGLFPYTHILDTLPRLLSGEILWFMPALIIAEIVWFFVFKICNNDEKRVIIVGLFISVIGLILQSYEVLNYAMINNALAIQWLFVLGKLIRKYESYIIYTVQRYLILLFCLYVLMGGAFLFLYPDVFYDVHDSRYYFIPLTWSIIIVGIFLAFYFFSKIKRIPKWLILIGQNTLLIYILHGYGRVIFKQLISFVSLEMHNFYPVVAVIETLFACSLCLGMSLLANKYLPEIVGQKRKKQ